jgi:hypothetical protein
MSRFAICALALCLTAAPLRAEEPALPLNDDIVAGTSLLEQGAKILLRGIMAEVEPSLRDLQGALLEARPVIEALVPLIDDLQNYHLPEKLPNGDILLRRKTPEELAAEGESLDL